ncbi:MAG: FAD-binding protein [Symbiopectobacterium sp.]
MAEFDRVVVESVFEIDVHYAAERSDWSLEQVLAPLSRITLFGVKTEEQLRSCIKGVTVPGVYAIGAVLAEFVPLARRAMARGIFIERSVLSVANTILQGEAA